MNRSGQAVAALAKFYKIHPESILVAHDELDLPPGSVRFKTGGGHGGHNGLRDLIGHPGSKEQVVDYVLTKPSQEDRRAIGAALESACDELPTLLAGEHDKAMNRLHSR